MAAGNTYVAIAEQTLGTAAASVTFSSISGTYTDLVLVVTGTMTGGPDIRCYMQFNGDTGSKLFKLQYYSGNWQNHRHQVFEFLPINGYGLIESAQS
jgi:hypothetical protein